MNYKILLTTDPLRTILIYLKSRNKLIYLVVQVRFVLNQRPLKIYTLGHEQRSRLED